ncbi:prostaglandin E2 receptor EP2 subtype isoform X2 [Heterocephalus glaber]|uniref:Prostaglandin E2 receptor EP2 subtype n=1 Tax=Heterocephalus glaber TaxID=10181 RepID=A0AAX6TC13_HETGA|nr:prostaglandin E2 receptor EP2 subtype isoform X2 [Heterocephalus glaber]
MRPRTATARLAGTWSAAARVRAEAGRVCGFVAFGSRPPPGPRGPQGSQTLVFPGASRGRRARPSRTQRAMGNASNASGPGDCERRQWLPAAGESPAISAAMFSAGVLGNLLALGLLARRGRGDAGRGAGGRGAVSLFHVLVTELVFTDLLGTCLISPVVLASYARNRTLVALWPDSRACTYFAFTMTFFSLATMLMLLAMALERYFAIGHPYFYQRRFSRRAGLAVLPAIYAGSLVLCSLPLLGYGQYVQYCPGTWCFIRHGRTAYLQLYATILLLLIVAVLACNFSVILNLVRMHRRGRRSRCGPSSWSGGPGPRRRAERLSVAEEADHLILLAIMTITFAVCSLPFTAFCSKTHAFRPVLSDSIKDTRSNTNFLFYEVQCQ